MHIDKTTEIDKDIFKAVIAKKGFSIRSLGYDTNPAAPRICTEKTIRRSFETGRMTTEIFEELAKYMDIDPRYLAGTREMKLRYRNLSRYLSNIDYHPFSREAFDKLKQLRRDNWLSTYLSAFNISIEQLNEKPFDEQYEFEHALLIATSKLIYKYFKVDADGDPNMSEMQYLLSSHEDWKTDHDIEVYADTVLRKEYIKNPPPGKSRDEISKMSPDAIIALDMAIQWASREKSADPFKEKYKKVPTEQDPTNSENK